MNEKLINGVIRKIESQQKGKEGTAVYGVGEQLKDICRTTPGAAELVLRDLDVEEMSIDKCEKKIKERADALHKKKGGSSVCVTPAEADRIIRKFYGIPDNSPDNGQAVTEEKIKPDIIDLESFL